MVAWQTMPLLALAVLGLAPTPQTSEEVPASRALHSYLIHARKQSP